MPANLENSAVATGLEKVSFHSNPKKGNAKKCSNYSTIALISYASKFNSVRLLVVSNSLQPHGLQYARLPCPSPAPGAYSNSCPLSLWCHPTISSSVVPFSSCPTIIRIFSNESVLHIWWPKYWSFSSSISPSKEHPGLISFRMDLLDLLAVQGTLKSLLQHHSSKASILRCSAVFI